MLVQFAAAFLLILGSGLLFRALLEIEAGSQTPARVGPRPLPVAPAEERRLDRAA
jgi:hypothetical protein